MSQRTRGAQGQPAPQEIRDALSALIEQRGETEIVRRCGIGRHTLARVVGGLPVRQGTVELLRVRLGAAEITRLHERQ